MSMSPGNDSSRLQPKQRAQRALRPQAPGPSSAVLARQEPGPVVPPNTTGHRLRASTVDDGTWLLFCAVCGAYAWKRAGSLARPCPRRVAPGAAGRLSDISKGLFPNRKSILTLGQPLPPSQFQLAWLSRRVCGRPQRRQPLSCRATWDALGPPAAPALPRTALLLAYGQDEGSFAQLSAKEAAADMRRVAKRPRTPHGPQAGPLDSQGSSDSSGTEETGALCPYGPPEAFQSLG